MRGSCAQDLDEARRGCGDEMAVLSCDAAHYAGLIEDAFDRAGFEAWFDSGTRRRTGGRLLAISAVRSKAAALRSRSTVDGTGAAHRRCRAAGVA